MQRTDHLVCRGSHVEIWWGVSVHINLGGGLEHCISNRVLYHSDDWAQTQAMPVVLKCIFTQLWGFIFYSVVMHSWVNWIFWYKV